MSDVTIHTAVSGAAQIIADLVTGTAAESFSHYQSVAYDNSEGIGKVWCVTAVMLLTVYLLSRCNEIL